MRRDRIPIKKAMIPYDFDILLADELFHLAVAYNENQNLFTITLEKDGECICEGEPLIYHVPLFQDIYQPGSFPALEIIPLDESGTQQEITWENFGESVFLQVDNVGGDENVE